MRADVPRDACCPGDALDHAVDIAAVDRVARERPQDESPVRAFAAAGLESSQAGHVIGIVAGLLPLPTRWSTRCPRKVSA